MPGHAVRVRCSAPSQQSKVARARLLWQAEALPRWWSPRSRGISPTRFSTDRISLLARVPVISKHHSGVMAGLVPAIHVLLAELQRKDVDARDKRGHDGGELIRSHRN